MRYSKTAITKLKNSINEKLPDEDDVFGFKGISKASISKALDESYNHLNLMDGCSAELDVICLKRNIAIYCEKGNDILKGGFEFSRDTKFNKLLDVISAIRKDIKQAYLLFIENSLMTAAQLGQLKENVDSISVIFDDYRETRNNLEGDYNRITEITESLMLLHDKLKDADPLIEGTKISIANLLSDAQVSHSNIEEYESVIFDTKKTILKNKTAYLASKNRLDKGVEQVECHSAKAAEIIDDISLSQEKIKKQQEYIQEIIDDAHRASMAGSFKTRKNELDGPIRMSGVVMNVALISIGIISFFLLYSSGITKNVFDWQSFATKLPIIAPLIWIAWSNSKKHNYLMRIREDYAFKYASAMAFEGYKKQVQDTDPDLEARLLQLAVENMGQNPIRLFDKKIQATPFNELLSSAGDVVDRVRGQVAKEKNTD